jgi:tRNA 2-thiouridine synthesizing protein E
LRTITSNAGVTTKELFALFPKGPAKKVARIAGLGKPEGCV